MLKDHDFSVERVPVVALLPLLAMAPGQTVDTQKKTKNLHIKFSMV